jgi:hypothetical protein
MKRVSHAKKRKRGLQALYCPLSDNFPKADFPNGRFPENFGRNYHNAGQNFRENVHSGNRLSGNHTVTYIVNGKWC